VAAWPECVVQLCLLPQLQDGNVAEVQKMAMRGLRLKVGIATGPVMDYISPATARIMYRGRVMNWAARISHLATGGQVGALKLTAN
jgi:class 3 adenylate cyclase